MEINNHRRSKSGGYFTDKQLFLLHLTNYTCMSCIHVKVSQRKSSGIFACHLMRRGKFIRITPVISKGFIMSVQCLLCDLSHHLDRYL